MTVFVGNTSGTDSAALLAALQQSQDSHGNTKSVLYDANGNALDPTQPSAVISTDSYVNIAAGTATTTIKSGPGTLARICINTKGASANVITVYDSLTASGNIIATIDGTSDRDHVFGLAFATGLTVKSATGTGADMTVVYR